MLAGFRFLEEPSSVGTGLNEYNTLSHNQLHQEVL